MVNSKLKPSTKMSYWQPVKRAPWSPLFCCSTERLTQTLRNGILYSSQLYETFKASRAHTAFSFFIPSFRAGRIHFSDHPSATSTKYHYNVTSEGSNFVGFYPMITSTGFQNTIVWMSIFFPMSPKTLAISKRTNVQQQVHSKRGKKRKQKQKNSKLQPSIITDIKPQTQFNH